MDMTAVWGPWQTPNIYALWENKAIFYRLSVTCTYCSQKCCTIKESSNGLFLLLLVMLVIDVDDWGKSVYKGLFQGVVLLGLGKESEILGSRKVSVFLWLLTHNGLIGNGPPISLHDESSTPCLLCSLWSSWDDQPPAHLVCFCMRILV